MVTQFSTLARKYLVAIKLPPPPQVDRSLQTIFLSLQVHYSVYGKWRSPVDGIAGLGEVSRYTYTASTEVVLASFSGPAQFFFATFPYYEQ